MSVNELENQVTEGVAETVSEVSTSNGFAKVAIIGAVVALGVGTVVYLRKRKAKKSENSEIETVTTTKKSTK